MDIEEEIEQAFHEWWNSPVDGEDISVYIMPIVDRVRAEAVREFRINDLRDRAEQADERWKAWGDVNDAELRDHLRRQADRIEQNSEGSGA